MARQTTTNGFPWIMTILLVFAALLHAAFAGSLLDARGSDPAGRGMALGFAAILGLVLWVVLASLFAIAFFKGSMPGYALAAAIVFLPLSAIAAASATGLYNERHGDWLIAVPLALPPLLALYALWARVVGLHAALPPGSTSAVLGGAVVVLTIAPLVLTTIEYMPNPERDAARAAAAKAQEEDAEKRRQEALAAEAARFARLGPDSPLGDYLDYLPPGDPRFREAVAGARLVRTRNADAVALLEAGRLGELADLWRLDIDPASVCAAYGMALKAAAGKVSRVNSNYIGAAIDLERQLVNIEWLVTARCDLRAALGEVEANVRTVADSARLTEFADKLAALGKPR